jgi:hypothetical protein
MTSEFVGRSRVLFRVGRAALSTATPSSPSTRTRPDAVAVQQQPPLPPRAIVLILYFSSRVFSLLLLVGVYLLAPVLKLPYASHGTSRPSFLAFLTSWDGKFYRQIAMSGYPAQLPLDAAGHVESNAWAFLPVYPWLTRGLMLLTGLSFDAAGVVLAVIGGAGAALLLYRLLAERIGVTRALWASAFFCFGPMTFLFETTYAESTFLALIFASLVMMTRRHYLLMIPFGVFAAFTRPGEVALAAALGILFIAQLARHETVPPNERVRMIVAGVSLAVAGFAWPVIADSVTGNMSAYFDTELSWWTGWVGRVHFIPFTPWFDLFYRYLGALGIVIVLALVVGFLWWLTRRSMRTLGDELLAYSGSYGGYLVAVFLPQQSIMRLLLPLSPLLGTPLLTQTPTARRITLTTLCILQPFAIVVLWFIYPP